MNLIPESQSLSENEPLKELLQTEIHLPNIPNVRTMNRHLSVNKIELAAQISNKLIRPTNFYILTRALVAFLGPPRFRFSSIGKFLISSGMVNADDVLANVLFDIAGTTTLAAAEVLIVECDDSAHVDSTDENIEALQTCLLQRALIGCNIGWLKLVLL
ncbi:hypothetical protein BpHYR1_013697 [Brachionus plicatilis]|uniref:Uncharacterized protein n=1 Tax=Brachionus plicatilis TaxID=10195 RepID=A0A3M7R650_BRAPC|nr:hypothetical protein BpHYR1_013697 [Brachionus plicatilis]